MSFVPSGFFLLRTPLLPFDELIAWSADLEAPAAGNDRQAQARAVAADRRLLRARLQAVVERPEVKEALFVASPDLVDSLEAWRREPEGERGQRVERAIVRYFARMAGRPTPFGLFAGTSVGTVGPPSRLECSGRASYGRHTRLDMNYLCSLVEAQGRDAELRKSLTYRPNSSLYRAGRRLRYTESRLANGSRSYHLVAVENSWYLEKILDRAKTGAVPQDLAETLLSADGDISMAEALDYVNELIDSQILVADLEAPVTGREPIHVVLESLRKHPAARPTAERLEEARRALDSMDAEGLGLAPERYRQIAASLSDLPAEIKLSRLFQVDMTKEAPLVSLASGVVDEIARGIEALHRISSGNLDSQFAQFREALIARYEGREVPLLEVLDEEVGIGFMRSTAPGAEASPLLDGLIFPGAAAATAHGRPGDAVLLRKVEDAILSQAREVTLDDTDLKALGPEEPPPLPDAFAVQATVCAASEADLARGDFQVLLGFAGGPSGARMLGRFCHGDPRLQKLVEEHLRAEEACDPEAIFAEVVHLPEGRLGNILCRPVLREYEIPFLGVSGVAADRQIPVDDLRLRVEGGRIVLRSARLGRRVIPRLTSAHSYTRRSLGVYRFLASLQDQGVSCGMTWIWGSLEGLRFLPRVRVGRAILSPARWRMDAHDLKALGSYQGADRYWAVQKMRLAWGLPRYVELADSDNELPIDLDNALSVDTFVELVRRRAGVILKEMLPGPDDLCASGPEGRFVHEIVVPFVRQAEAPKRAHRFAAPTSGRSPRRFPPGSEWLYAKLYTGTASADLLLREMVAPLTREAIDSGAADRWFFIRYSDPDWHLRLRLHGDPERLRSETLSMLHKALEPFLEDGLVWRVQLDTYEREVERYGGAEGMEIAERIFHADSEAALAILDQLEGDDGADARWRLALRGIDSLLQDIGLDLDSRHRLMVRVRDGFHKEFGAGKALDIQLGNRFRKERRGLERLCGAAPSDDPLAPALEPLHTRSERLAAAVADLNRLSKAGRLTMSREDLAASYIHMHVNRLLRSAHKAQELVLYDFLERLYKSSAARLKSRPATEPDSARQPGLDRILEPGGNGEPGLHHDHPGGGVQLGRDLLHHPGNGGPETLDVDPHARAARQAGEIPLRHREADPQVI